MKKLILWLPALAVLAAFGYGAWRKFPDKVAFWKSSPAAATKKAGAPATAIVATRDIHFAVTAAGDIGPLDAVSVKPEVGGLIHHAELVPRKVASEHSP